MASFYQKAKRFGKRFIGYPSDEERVPIVTVAHWIRGLRVDPKRDVRAFPSFVIAVADHYLRSSDTRSRSSLSLHG